MDYKERLVEISSGVYVENDVLGVVEEIQRRFPTLDVQFLDPRRFPELTDAPYRIIEHCPDGFDRILFSTWQLDNRVIDRIYAADTSRGNILDRIDQNNTRVREGEQRRFQERLDEAADLAAHVLKAGTTYSFKNTDGELIVLRDDEGITKRVGG